MIVTPTSFAYHLHRAAWDNWALNVVGSKSIAAVVYRPSCDWVWVQECIEPLTVLASRPHRLITRWRRLAIAPPSFEPEST